MLERKTVVLVKTETTPGTDPTPTAIANAIQVEDFVLEPLNLGYEQQVFMRAFLGANGEIPTVEDARVTFKVPLQSSGAAGTAPKVGPLLKACGLAEVISAGIDVQYNPVSAAFSSVTIYAYKDGVLHKLTYSRGKVKIEMSAAKIPYLMFDFLGLFSPVTDAALPSNADYSGFLTPRASIPVWTGAITIGAYAPKVDAFSIDLGNQVEHITWMNAESIEIVDRDASGAMTVEAVTVATKDYWADVRAVTRRAVSVQHGNVAGQIVVVAAPAVQFKEPRYGEKNKVLTLQMGLKVHPVSGNDEVLLTFK